MRSTFRSKPQEIEATQWTGDNVDDFYEYGLKVLFGRDDDGPWNMLLKAGKDGAQEYVPVPVGHWVVHMPGDMSDMWPVDDEYFRNKYDEVLIKS